MEDRLTVEDRGPTLSDSTVLNLDARGPAVPAGRFEAYQGTARFGSLDGLRFLSIAAVLWHHAPIWGAMENAPRLLERGFLGVDFFFVLSGFLITTLLLREETRKGRFSLADFYWRRILRIIPVYFLVVTLLGGYFVLYKGETQYAGMLPYYYLFLANFLVGDIPALGPTWSLSVEEQFYLIWPALMLMLPRRWLVPALIGLIAVNVLAMMQVFQPLGVQGVRTSMLYIALPNSTYAPILMGALLAVMMHSQAGYNALYRLFGNRFTALPAFAALILLMQVLPDDLRGLPNLAVHSAMTICLAAIVLREDNVLNPVLAWKPVARVGEVSYGIYLYHLVALHLVNWAMLRLGMGGGNWVILFAYSALSVLMAEVSFRTFEAVFRRFRNRRPFRKG